MGKVVKRGEVWGRWWLTEGRYEGGGGVADCNLNYASKVVSRAMKQFKHHNQRP